MWNNTEIKRRFILQRAPNYLIFSFQFLNFFFEIYESTKNLPATCLGKVASIVTPRHSLQTVVVKFMSTEFYDNESQGTQDFIFRFY